MKPGVFQPPGAEPGPEQTFKCQEISSHFRGSFLGLFSLDSYLHLTGTLGDKPPRRSGGSGGRWLLLLAQNLESSPLPLCFSFCK